MGREVELRHYRPPATGVGTLDRLGLNLAGVSKRLSRDDLLTAIVNPSRDVASAYRVSNVDTKDGKRLSGIVVFESVDGLLVQTGAEETKRIAAANIESRTPSPKSLMPDGLLKGLRPEDLADLFGFWPSSEIGHKKARKHTKRRMKPSHRKWTGSSSFFLCLFVPLCGYLVFSPSHQAHR